MKNTRWLLILQLACICLLLGLADGCKKEKTGNSPIGIATSFTEEFEAVYGLEDKGWVFKDNSEYSTRWVQATTISSGKVILPPPFPAYSYTVSSNEYISASVSMTSSYYSVSSWLITPVLSVKNGDKISFYTRADTGRIYQERMQVLINNSTSSNVGGSFFSVGSFTTTLFDINPAYTPAGYPITWTKFEHTFSGISGRMDTRIAFRYFVPASASSNMIGIDLFRFESN